ncbi:hypothetical protein BCU71_19300 [Vibrio lentus]|uniref:hypothetical protein n=1 Tax=Vibrio lentus TaxID=136468 RepID=UPI000C858F51|nr:hypothetical protein [Vibrio lentus]PMH28887.1 hypothetical protein BCU71_19300 [Vibrio lentus]PMK68450.1 hypothetical protein BCT93_18430 [Vibrio lentus]
MKWKKFGNIYLPRPISDALLTHAANPLPIHLKDDIFRVFFNGRNNENKSSLGYFDFDIVTKEIVNVCDKEIVKFGSDESYYSHGLSIGNEYTDIFGDQYILFMAWQIRGDSHWRGDIGRIKVESLDEIYVEDLNLPFITINEVDKVSLSYPCVYKEGKEYKMIYGSTITWEAENGEMVHVLNQANSIDGDTWKQVGLAVPYEIGIAQAFSRPTHLRLDGQENLWFSYRSGSGEKYRIGRSYKEGECWHLDLENSGIDVSKDENQWDSEMICYPYVLMHKGITYMFYNGNGFGETGIGLAVLEV